MLIDAVPSQFCSFRGYLGKEIHPGFGSVFQSRRPHLQGISKNTARDLIFLMDTKVGNANDS